MTQHASTVGEVLMQPEFLLEPHFDVIGFGMDYLKPPALVYFTVDRKLMKLDWGADRITYHLPETYQTVEFKTLAAAFYAAYGKGID